MSIEQFIRERKYVHDVSPETLTWYEQSFKRFAATLGAKTNVATRIAELKERWWPCFWQRDWMCSGYCVMGIMRLHRGQSIV